MSRRQRSSVTDSSTTSRAVPSTSGFEITNTGRARGVIGALDERQPGNDLWGLRRRELRPPGTGARTPVHGEHAEIADRIANRADDLASPKMWRARSCEPEMKARRVSHRGVAARYVDMDAVGRLDIGEG